ISAPCPASVRAIPQAMEWSFATPITSPRRPCINPLTSVMRHPPFVDCSKMGRTTSVDPSPAIGVLHLRGVTLEDERGVGAAETETVGQHPFELGPVDPRAHDRRVRNFRIDLLDIRALGD